MGKNITAALALALATSLAQATTPPDFYGTDAPFASNAVYFVMTDRFVNGDPANDHRDQGGTYRTFDIPVPGPNGQSANIGYLGGDFKGVLDNAGYIRGMGFGAVWITPIVDNPDEPFTGGTPVSWGSFWTDQGKTGYHGYWGDNFYQLDEHLPSKGLDFAQFNTAMHAQGLKVVLDIVANHGSPAFGMTRPQAKFGRIFDKHGKLLADTQNLPPYRLDPMSNPLHAYYHAYEDVAQLSNMDDENPAVLDYFVGAYLQWAGQGADAFRIDTMNHMPTAFWKQFATRIRARHPGFFMFGEAFDYDPDNLGQYTWPKNGGISVIDFPLKQQLKEVFEHPASDYSRVLSALYLTNGPYANRTSWSPSTTTTTWPASTPATMASSTRTTGCSLPAASRPSTTVRKPVSSAAAPSTKATATTMASSASTPHQRVPSTNTSGASPNCVKKLPPCNAA